MTKNPTIPYHKTISIRNENVATAKELREKGYSYSQIGRTLGVSKMTASNYVNNYGKQTKNKKA